ncbi:hypothetical protein E2562_012663 [Oryza meyeriana var. granulata]|uniref:Uncharacterized protein n=1 Tax=Oryza meyeriana var. granulata TaxID=110450 RepID=A0A6G1CFZ6_9ORYZ|nr:hypothetical protein E2562_012663 [Oryza meyeriana var. granulata]
MPGAAILTAAISQAGGPLREASRLVAVAIARGREMYVLVSRFAPAGGDADWVADRLLFKAHASEAQRMLAAAAASAIAAEDALVLASAGGARRFGDWVSIALRHLDCAHASLDAARTADAAARVLVRKARDLARRLIQPPCHDSQDLITQCDVHIIAGLTQNLVIYQEYEKIVFRANHYRIVLLCFQFDQ